MRKHDKKSDKNADKCHKNTAKAVLHQTKSFRVSHSLNWVEK